MFTYGTLAEYKLSIFVAICVYYIDATDVSEIVLYFSLNLFPQKSGSVDCRNTLCRNHLLYSMTYHSELTTFV